MIAAIIRSSFVPPHLPMLFILYICSCPSVNSPYSAHCPFTISSSFFLCFPLSSPSSFTSSCQILSSLSLRIFLLLLFLLFFLFFFSFVVFLICAIIVTILLFLFYSFFFYSFSSKLFYSSLYSTCLYVYLYISSWSSVSFTLLIHLHFLLHFSWSSHLAFAFISTVFSFLFSSPLCIPLFLFFSSFNPFSYFPMHSFPILSYPSLLSPSLYSPSLLSSYLLYSSLLFPSRLSPFIISSYLFSQHHLTCISSLPSLPSLCSSISPLPSFSLPLSILLVVVPFFALLSLLLLFPSTFFLLILHCSSVSSFPFFCVNAQPLSPAPSVVFILIRSLPVSYFSDWGQS